MASTIRPEIDGDDSLINRVHAYARDNGIRINRAWADLVRAGLDAAEGGDDD